MMILVFLVAEDNQAEHFKYRYATCATKGFAVYMRQRVSYCCHKVGAVIRYFSCAAVIRQVSL